MKLLIDMNLSPQWVPVLEAADWRSVHWTSIGRPTATDEEILAYAKLYEYVVFTHDLDFGAILASTNAETPSVIQVRVQDVAPDHLSDCVIAALHQFKQLLDMGALVTIDDKKSRARILPLNSQ
jgi:predicted nuclease of predicted toxin-antitoxin system